MGNLRRLLTLTLSVLIAMMTIGCGLTGVRVEDQGAGLELYCSPSAPLSIGAEQPADSADRPHRAGAGVASTLDWMPLLDELRTFNRKVAEEQGGAVFRMLKIHQQLVHRSMRVGFEVSSVAAEVECRRTSVDNILDALQKRNESLSNMETGASVILAGVTNILTGGFTLAASRIANGVAAIVGGTVSGSLGALGLANQARYELKHERNLLREVWEGPDRSHVFPSDVWRLITQRREDGKSLRDRLVESWREQLKRLEEKQGEDRTDLLFGDGGVYGIEDLRTRLRMLGDLSSLVDLLHQDLQAFMAHLGAQTE